MYVHSHMCSYVAFKFIFENIQQMVVIQELLKKKYISLSTVVLNSRDQQGKLWLPQFSHF